MQNNPATSGARGMSSKLVGRRGKPPGAHLKVNCVNNGTMALEMPRKVSW